MYKGSCAVLRYNKNWRVENSIFKTQSSTRSAGLHPTLPRPGRAGPVKLRSGEISPTFHPRYRRNRQYFYPHASGLKWTNYVGSVRKFLYLLYLKNIRSKLRGFLRIVSTIKTISNFSHFCFSECFLGSP